MGLRDIGASLPPGFRFYPSDEELVCHYLYKKIANEDVLKGTLVEIDLHTCEPWQLPGEFRGCLNIGYKNCSSIFFGFDTGLFFQIAYLIISR
ncbi:putative transcription factor NAM family [Helianthus annuus]|nr:putative transcription factor NAM family [Helianthus annuus]